MYRYVYGTQGLDDPSAKESKTAKNFPIPNHLPRGPCGATGLNEDLQTKSDTASPSRGEKMCSRLKERAKVQDHSALFIEMFSNFINN